MENELVHYEIDRGIAVLRLDDPPANTYTYEMFRQLDETILRARMDNEVQVIMIRGAGEKFFSAGADVKKFRDGDVETNMEMIRISQAAFRRMAAAEQVFVAQIGRAHV